MRVPFPSSLRLAGLLAMLLLLSCGGDSSTTGPASTPPPPPPPLAPDHIDVTVSTGWWIGSADVARSADVPDEITSVELAVLTADDSVSMRVDLSADVTRAEFPVNLAVGKMTLFRMTARDAAEVVRYRGVYYHAVLGTDDAYDLTMGDATDTEAPDFTDDLTVTALGSHDLELSWSAATTGGESDPYASYLIWTTTAGKAPAELPDHTTGPGQTNTVLSDLSPDRNYQITVRAVDSAGNVTANAATQSASTQSGGEGLYVDVMNGQDAPDRGGPDQPLRTITYALNLTEGNEPIYIRRGTYSTATGERFPLVLKDGTELRGVFQIIYGYPVVNIVAGTGEVAIQGSSTWNWISSLKVSNEGPESSAGTLIAAREGRLYMQLVVIDGNGGYTNSAVSAGKRSIIKYCIFKDLPQASGIAIYGDGFGYINGCDFYRVGRGVSGSRSHARVYNCDFYDCIFGIIWRGCEDVAFAGNSIHGGEGGFDLTEMSNSTVWGCQVFHTNSTGIQLNRCQDSLHIEYCRCDSCGTGVYVHYGSATLTMNTLACNQSNLYVTGHQDVDARRNSWSESPPIVVSDDSPGSYDHTDISYTAVYAGTPMPQWDPCLPAGSCLSILVSPMVGQGSEPAGRKLDPDWEPLAPLRWPGD